MVFSSPPALFAGGFVFGPRALQMLRRLVDLLLGPLHRGLALLDFLLLDRRAGRRRGRGLHATARERDGNKRENGWFHGFLRPSTAPTLAPCPSLITRHSSLRVSAQPSHSRYGSTPRDRSGPRPPCATRSSSRGRGRSPPSCAGG